MKSESWITQGVPNPARLAQLIANPNQTHLPDSIGFLSDWNPGLEKFLKTSLK